MRGRQRTVWLLHRLPCRRSVQNLNDLLNGHIVAETNASTVVLITYLKQKTGIIV
jgi:hypothetical protein